MKKSTTRIGALALTGAIVGSGLAGAFVAPAFAAEQGPKPETLVKAAVTEVTGPADCAAGTTPIREVTEIHQDWLWDENADDGQGGIGAWVADPAGPTGGVETFTTRASTTAERAEAECGPGDTPQPARVTTKAAYTGAESLDCERNEVTWTNYGAEWYDFVWDVNQQKFVAGETQFDATTSGSRPATAEECDDTENPGGGEGENPGGGEGENPGGGEGENPGGGEGENPGGENPGGENPGGENPGGENPGGENPGGENPGGAEEPKNDVKQSDAVAGEDFRVTGSGFKPNEVVKIYLHSDPIFLGTLTADAAGKIDGFVKIPANAPAGEHHIVIVDTAGVEYTSGTITVKAAPAAPAAVKAEVKEESHPDTGFGLLAPLSGALTLLAAGGAAFVARKRLGATA
ncbi:hypothetical protein ACFVAJ_19240 [Agromyces sp. NPDC057679]|uniref:hypothetical protein n=1 Tax=Agromyces sp. NPDC057679 TaxID=3346207 RepID=UPI00366F3F2E